MFQKTISRWRIKRRLSQQSVSVENNSNYSNITSHVEYIARYRPNRVIRYSESIIRKTRIDFAVAKISSNPVDVDNPISKNGNFRSSVLTDETKGLDGKKSGKR